MSGMYYFGLCSVPFGSPEPPIPSGTTLREVPQRQTSRDECPHFVADVPRPRWNQNGYHAPGMGGGNISDAQSRRFHYESNCQAAMIHPTQFGEYPSRRRFGEPKPDFHVCEPPTAQWASLGELRLAHDTLREHEDLASVEAYLLSRPKAAAANFAPSRRSAEHVHQTCVADAIPRLFEDTVAFGRSGKPMIGPSTFEECGAKANGSNWLQDVTGSTCFDSGTLEPTDAFQAEPWPELGASGPARAHPGFSANAEASPQGTRADLGHYLSYMVRRSCPTKILKFIDAGAELEPEGTVNAEPVDSQPPWPSQKRNTGDHMPTEDQHVEVTTMAIRNLPLATTQSDLLQELNLSGFADQYDYAYLPRHFDTGLGKGHAFVNFVTAATASIFQRTWDQTRRFCLNEDPMALSVVPATVQGYRANMRNWTPGKLTRVKNRDHVPFTKGVSWPLKQ